MEEYSQYDDMGGVPQQQSSLKGYKIVIGLMALVMIVMSALYYKQIQTLRGSSEELTVERDNIWPISIRLRWTSIIYAPRTIPYVNR